MESRSLFFDATKGMTDDDGGIFLCGIIVRREIEVANYINLEFNL